MRQPHPLTRAGTDEEAAATDHVAGGGAARVALTLAWAVILAMYLTHSIVLSSDSVNNHVHVWWIARTVWHHGQLPWRFPALAHGEAYAYPYGFVNWTTAALVWPLFGDWAVTLWTAIGAVGCIVATFVAFPELRRGWWAAAVLANSALIEGLLFGQQSFLWAAMLLLFGIALWRNGRRAWAAILVGLGQATHAAVLAPIALIVVLLYLPFTNDRRAVIRWYALSCVMALPAVWLALASPTNGEISAGSRMLNFWITIGPRIMIVVFPLFLVLLRRLGWVWLAPAAMIVPLIFNVGLEFPLNVGAQWHALTHHGADTTTLDAYLRSPQFQPGATYRVLRTQDGKLGLYHVVRAGGVLDSEMFPESMAIRSFHDTADYERALCRRAVDQILAFASYDARHTNERAVLRRLAARPGTWIRLAPIVVQPGFEAYAVDHTRCPSS